MSSSSFSASSNGADDDRPTGTAKQFATESDFEQVSTSDDDHEGSDQSSLDNAGSEDGDSGKDLDDIPFSALLKAQTKVKQRSLKRKRGDQHQASYEGPSRSGLGQADRQSEPKSRSQHRDQRIPSRPNKHAPQEMSSKRAVKRARTVVETPKANLRDPRFDNLSGSFDNERFERSYGFLKQNKQAELAQLKHTLKKAKKSASISNADKETLQRQFTRLESSVATDKRKEQEANALRTWKKSEREKQQSTGKQPFYLKDKQRKDIIEKDRTSKMDKRQLKKREQRRTSRQNTKEAKDRPPVRLTGANAV